MGARQKVSHVFATDLPTIEAEIVSYRDVISQADRTAGSAILEIGKRLRFVKERDLIHGQWLAWLARMGIETRSAQRFIQASEQFGDTTLATHLTATKIIELLSLPSGVNRTSFIRKKHTVPSSGESKSVEQMSKAELREVVKAEREAAGLAKDRNTPKEGTSEEVSALDEIPYGTVKKILKLNAERRACWSELAAHLSGSLIAEKFIDIGFEVNRGAPVAEIVSRFKKPPNKTPIQTLGLDPYEVLGVNYGESREAIRKKYRALVQAAHPDKGGSEFLFKIVQAAWETVSR